MILVYERVYTSEELEKYKNTMLYLWVWCSKSKQQWFVKKMDLITQEVLDKVQKQQQIKHERG